MLGPVLHSSKRFYFKHLFVLVIAAIVSVAVASGCSVEDESQTNPVTLAEPDEDSITIAEDCHVLSNDDTDLLKNLQAEIPYDVLVPACLPGGYRLDASSISRTKPLAEIGSATGDYEYEKRPSYRYVITDGITPIDFAGNIIGDPGMMILELKQVRGQQAFVYIKGEADENGLGVAVPFENSPYYNVLWDEERDLVGGRDRYGAYFAHADQMSWDALLGIIESMVPVNDLDGDGYESDTETDSENGTQAAPLITVMPSQGACSGGQVSIFGSGMPEGEVAVRMILPGSSGFGDASLGTARADDVGNWSLDTEIPTEFSNHWRDQVTTEPTFNGRSDTEWILEATGADGDTVVKGTLTILNCQT